MIWNPRRTLGSQGIFRRHPATRYALTETLETDYAPSVIAPVAHGFCFTESGKHNGTSLIAGLLNNRCPSDIPRFIVPVVIRESIKRMFCAGAWANISRKVAKRLAPLFAHCDTSTAVVMKALFGRHIAALQHPLPYNKEWMLLNAMSNDSLATPRASVAAFVRAIRFKPNFVTRAASDFAAALLAGFHSSPPGDRSLRVVKLGKRSRSERLSAWLAIPRLSPRLFYQGVIQ